MSDPAAPLFDLVGPLRAGWKRVGLVTGVALAVAVAVALLSPKWYLAQLSVVPVPPTKGGLPSLGGGGSGGMAAALELPIDIGLGGSDVERIGAVFRSLSVTDAVIAKFDLIKRYEDTYIEEAREDLWQHCSTSIDKKPGVVALSCEDKDPAIAKAIVEFFGEYGNEVFRRISRSSASEERRFLEKRVADARREMVETSARLREFQEKNKVIDLPEQSKAVVAVMATLRADLLSKQIQLGYLSGVSARDESSSEQLRRQVSVLQSKLHSLEDGRSTAAAEEAARAAKKGASRGKGGRENGSGLFPDALAVPKLRFELEQLFRDQKVQELLFLMLAQRFENARVSEARDTSTFQILDSPRLPTKKVRPKRLVICVTGLVVGLLLGIAWVLVPPWWRSLPGRAQGRARRVG